MFDFMPKGKPEGYTGDLAQSTDTWQNLENAPSLPQPLVDPTQVYKNQLPDLSLPAPVQPNIFQNALGGLKWYGTHPGQLLGDFGQGVASELSKLSTRNSANINDINASSPFAPLANFGKQSQVELQANQDYNIAHPVTTVPGMLGQQIPEIPLWMTGEGAITSLASKIPMLGKVASKLPGIVNGGLRDAATYGTIVAPTESVANGDNLQQFLNRESQLPSVVLGGMALRGAGKAIDSGVNAGLNTLNPIRKIAPELQQAEAATNTRLQLQNPLQDVQNAYKVPSLRDIKQQEYNQIFSGNQQPLTAQADLEAAFSKDGLAQPSEQPRINLPQPELRTWTNKDGIPTAPETHRSLANGELITPKAEPKFGFTNPTGSNLQAAAAKIESPTAPIQDATLTEQTAAEAKKTGIIQKVRDLIQNSDQWKDKKPMSLQTETWDRNIIDIAGKDEGKAVKEYIFDPIHTHEADRTRWINGWSDQIKNLGLNKDERAIVQQVGEGKLNINDVPVGVDKQKILKSVDTFRNFYDKAIDQSNKVLVENGYNPIEKLPNYFPHFDGGDPILKALGLHINNVELPTDINGLTANFKPGKNWVGNFLHRTGDKTTFDAVEGFDRYVHGVSKVIYHTEDIQKLRTFNRELRLKYSPEEIQKQVESIMSNKGLDQATKDTAIEELLGRSKTQLSNSVADLEEFTNVLAGKKDLADRGDERRFGRQIYGIASEVEGRIAKNMTSINPSTWLTQFIPITQSLATTSKPAVLRAMGETMADAGKTILNVAKQFGKTEKNTSLGRDGFVDMSTFLTNRKGANVLSRGAVDKVGEALTSPMRWVDNFSSQVVTRSKYLEGIQKGMSHEESLKRADDWASKLMADRSLGSMPTLFNQKSPLTKLVTMFQLEVNNQIHFMTKDMPREYLNDGKTVKNIARLTSAMTQLMVYSWMYNQAFQVVTGRRPALDPIGMALGYNEDKNNPNLGTKGAITNLVQNVTQQIPFVGGLLGGGRIPISSAVTPLTKLPGNALDISTNPNGPLPGLKAAGTNLLTSGAYIVPPFGGSQAKKTITGALDLKKGGEFQGNQLKFPVNSTLGNTIRGLTFGPSTFTEAQKYYNNSLKPLSEKQTQDVTKSSDVPYSYNLIMRERTLNTIDDKIKNVRNNSKMSDADKQKQILFLQLQRGKV